MSYRALYGGKFYTRTGGGSHPCRTIDSWELIAVVSGELKLFVAEENYTVQPGEFLILPPEVRHGGVGIYPAGLSFYWLHFYGPEKPRVAQYGTLRNPDKTVGLFQLFLVNQSESDAPVESADLLLRLLLGEFGREGRSATLASAAGISAKRVIQARFAEPEFSASAVAEELNLNRDYLNRIFKREFGCSLTGFLLQTRLEHCLNMLLNTTLSIKEIMFSSGFGDAAYFHRLFFRRFSCTPRHYRNFHAPEYTNTTRPGRPRPKNGE